MSRSADVFAFAYNSIVEFPATANGNVGPISNSSLALPRVANFAIGWNGTIYYFGVDEGADCGFFTQLPGEGAQDTNGLCSREGGYVAVREIP